MGKIAFRTAAAIALLNFIAFTFASLHFGGVVPNTPFRTIMDEGPYFLDEHGQLTEVSRQVFVALTWQARFFILSWSLIVIWGIYLRLKK
jgi:hypothetical protein